MKVTKTHGARALLATLALLLATAPGAHAVRMYAIGNSDNNLRSFESTAPGTPIVNVGVTGLAAGEFLYGIDVRPATGELYGVTSANKIYVINPVSGAATQVGPTAFSPSIVGYVGMDFNPTVDRLRLVNDSGVDLRINPITGALAAQDTNLNPGLPFVTAAAYSNNYNGATSTTLYDIDTNSDTLYVQNPPNNGTLTSVGALGQAVGPLSGFDIDSTGIAYAVLNAGGASDLWTIDLTSGAASSLGSTGTLLDGLAVYSQPPAPVQVDVPSRVVAENSGTTPIALRRTGGSLLDTLVVDVTIAEGTATRPDDFVTTSSTVTFAPGETTKNINVAVVDDAVHEGNEFFQLSLSNARSSTAGPVPVASPSTTIIGIADDDAAPVNTGPTGPIGATGPTGATGPHRRGRHHAVRRTRPSDALVRPPGAPEGPLCRQRGVQGQDPGAQGDQGRRCGHGDREGRAQHPGVRQEEAVQAWALHAQAGGDQRRRDLNRHREAHDQEDLTAQRTVRARASARRSVSRSPSMRMIRPSRWKARALPASRGGIAAKRPVGVMYVSSWGAPDRKTPGAPSTSTCSTRVSGPIVLVITSGPGRARSSVTTTSA